MLARLGRAARGATPVDPRTLVVLRAGANDFLDALTPAVAERVNAHLLEPRLPQAAPDAAGFLWWDGWGHLTSAFHGLLADEAAAVVGRMA